MKVIAVIIVKDEMKLIFKRWQKKKKRIKVWGNLKLYFSSSFLLQHFYYSTHLSWWRNLMTYVVNTLFPISYIHRFGMKSSSYPQLIKFILCSIFEKLFLMTCLTDSFDTPSMRRQIELKSFDIQKDMGNALFTKQR